jgi:hypothetical protein
MDHRALDLVFDAPLSLPRSIFSVMAFTVVALGVYAYASYELHKETLPLTAKCQDLEDKLYATRGMTKELSEMVASLSDPAADEYALITELGRIPERSRKVVIKYSGAPTS